MIYTDTSGKLRFILPRCRYFWITCPGVMALNGSFIITHTDPSRFKVTVHGAEKKQDVYISTVFVLLLQKKKIKKEKKLKLFL